MFSLIIRQLEVIDIKNGLILKNGFEWTISMSFGRYNYFENLIEKIPHNNQKLNVIFKFFSEIFN